MRIYFCQFCFNLFITKLCFFTHVRKLYLIKKPYIDSSEINKLSFFFIKTFKEVLIPPFTFQKHVFINKLKINMLCTSYSFLYTERCGKHDYKWLSV